MSPAFDDRRSHLREAAGGQVRLVTRSGHVLDADLIDRSLKGMRVRLADAGTLPPDVSVVWVAGAAVYDAAVVWRTPPYAGLSIRSAVDMRAPPSANDSEAHRLWREYARG